MEQQGSSSAASKNMGGAFAGMLVAATYFDREDPIEHEIRSLADGAPS